MFQGAPAEEQIFLIKQLSYSALYWFTVKV